MNEPEIKKKKNFFKTVEGFVFLLGIVIFVIGFLFVLPQDIPSKWRGLLTMILTGIAGGKGISIPVGLGILPKELVFIAAALQDLVVVFLFFPLIVFFKNKISKTFMGDIVKSAQDVADRHGSKLKTFGVVIGVGFFVWIPLTMTGPLVGAVLGLILGMKTFEIILTVSVAGVLSAWCWTYLFGFMINWSKEASKWWPAVAVVIMLVLILVIKLQQRFKKESIKK